MNSLSVLKGKHAYLVTAIILVMLWGMGNMFISRVSVVPSSAPETVFSGERAFAIASDLLRENTPHPAGSAANKVIRDRIRARLSDLGLESELQADFKCSHLSPGCAFVENIIALKKGAEGSEGRPAILVTSHYDSVPAAPGAGDATSGVAAMLEIAFNLKNTDAMANDVIFLFTDAEETGLRGAMAFVDDHPLFSRVGLVLNMEARGVSGPSMMFETGPNNLKQIEGFMAASHSPTASSLIIEIYKRMPNATDYTVYKMHGLPGLNFAFSQGVSLYHAPKDDIQHLDIKSVQHQGDNVLAAIKVFGDQDLGQLIADQDATYFDVFGVFLISWAASMGVPVLGLAFGAFLYLIWQHRSASFKQLAWALVFIVLTIVALPIVGWLLSMPLGQFGGLQPLDHPYPWPARFALLCAALLVAFLMARLALRMAGVASLFYGVWGLYLILAGITVLTISGASYMFLTPVLLATVTGFLWSFKNRDGALYAASLVGALVGAYMGLYHLAFTEALMNFQLSHFKINTLVLLALPMLVLSAFWYDSEMIAQKTTTKAVAGLLVVFNVMAVLVPAATADRPMPMVYSYHAVTGDDDAYWQVQGVEKMIAPLLSEAGFVTEQQAFTRYGVSDGMAWIKPGQKATLEAPSYLITKNEVVDGQRIIEGSFKSNRKAFNSGLSIKKSEMVASLLVEDQLILGHPDRPSNGPRVLRMHGAGQRALSFKLIMKDVSAPELFVFDQGAITDVAGADPLIKLRPETATTVHNGDISVLVTSLNLEK